MEENMEIKNLNYLYQNKDIKNNFFVDFSYIFIIPSENENKFETSDLCDVFKYYKMVSGSSY